MKIFTIKKPDELVCPIHHIELTYQHDKDNGELILKCDWCDYTLVPLTDERKKIFELHKLKKGYNMSEKGKPKQDGSGKGARDNKGRGGCSTTKDKGKGCNK